MAVNTFTNYGQPGHSGYQKFGPNGLSVVRKPIFFPAGQTIATITDVISQTNWTTITKAAMATRVHPFPLSVDTKPTGGNAIMAKTALSGDRVIREDALTLQMDYDIDVQLAAFLRNFNKRKMDVAFVDSFGNMFGTTPDGIKFQGFSTGEIFMGPRDWSDGSKLALNQLVIVLTNPNQWNNAPALIKASSFSWLPSELSGTYGVNIAVSNASGAGFKASVLIAGLDSTDPNAQLTGLVKADFVVLNSSGVPQSLSAGSLLDNGDGTYTMSGLSLSAGTYSVTLINPPSAISVVNYNIEVANAGTMTF
jgi:hypothetical protein